MNSMTTTLKYNPQVFISSHIYKQKPPLPPTPYPRLHISTQSRRCERFRGNTPHPSSPLIPVPATRTPGASDRTSQPIQHSATGHPETPSDVTSWLSSEYKRRWDLKKKTKQNNKHLIQSNKMSNRPENTF